MKRPFSVTVWREGDWFVSQCLDVDIASQGQTEDEAFALAKTRSADRDYAYRFEMDVQQD